MLEAAHEGQKAMSIFAILIVVALILAVLASFGVPCKIGLFPLAFAFFLLALLIGGLHAIG